MFRTGFYVRYLEPAPYAGNFESVLTAGREKQFKMPHHVLVVGDSQIAEGFSPQIADEAGAHDGFEFFNAAVGSRLSKRFKRNILRTVPENVLAERTQLLAAFDDRQKVVSRELKLPRPKTARRTRPKPTPFAPGGAKRCRTFTARLKGRSGSRIRKPRCGEGLRGFNRPPRRQSQEGRAGRALSGLRRPRRAICRRART